MKYFPELSNSRVNFSLSSSFRGINYCQKTLRGINSFLYLKKIIWIYLGSKENAVLHFPLVTILWLATQETCVFLINSIYVNVKD